MKRDDASSIVIGFVILLTIVALGIGIWALISVPAEMKAAESSHAIKLQNVFLDFKLSADKIRVNDLAGARFSMLVPAREGMSGATMGFANSTDSTLTIYLGNSIDQKQWKGIGRLSAKVGGTRGTTTIGYEAGGVFRSDNGKAVWLTPGLIDVYPEIIQGNTTVRVDMVMPVLSGDATISSNWGVPVDCVYTGKSDSVVGPYNETLTIVLTSSDKEKRELWYSLFYEAATRYNATRDVWISEDEHREGIKEVSVHPAISGDRVELWITARDSNWVKVYIREATYNVSLVNR